MHADDRIIQTGSHDFVLQRPQAVHDTEISPTPTNLDGVMSHCSADLMNGRQRESRRAVEIVEPSAETRTTANPAIGPGERDAVDEGIAEALMIPLAVVRLDELAPGAPSVALPQWHHPREALVLD